MLQKCDDPISDAYDHAAQYSQRAKRSNPREREDWRALERRYLMLAQSLELSGRLMDLVGETKRRRK
jgi:hypothetical protein